MMNTMKNSRAMRRGTIWVGVLLLILGVVLGWLAGQNSLAQPGTALSPVADVAPTRVLDAEERATVDLFREASPSVVYVTAVSLRRDFFTMNVQEVPRGTGTGFVWDAAGHVVTNFHVVQPGSRYIVRLADQSEWRAEIVGIAPDKDLAVLRIDAPHDQLKPLAVGRSDDLEVGMKVFAIGNPFGLDQTLTTGIVSALGRTIVALTGVTIYDVIQTDAAINPGNSGGPLLDSAGRLIGVNTAIQSPSGANAGIGFAVPVDTVAHIVPQLIESGRVVVPTLGIRPAPYRLARALGVNRGVLVLNVFEDTGADRAGLRGTYERNDGRIVRGDVIVSIEDRPIDTERDLYSTLQDFEQGDSINVGIIRDRELMRVELELGAPAAAGID